MQQTGNMPSHRYARGAGHWVPESSSYNITTDSSTHAFPAQQALPYPYCPHQYYGQRFTNTFPTPTVTQHGQISNPEYSSTYPPQGMPYFNGHPHPVYPTQHDYYNQFYDPHFHLPAGPSATSDGMGKNDSSESGTVERSEYQCTLGNHENLSPYQDSEGEEHSDS
jgi:hypothetical protein